MVLGVFTWRVIILVGKGAALLIMVDCIIGTIDYISSVEFVVFVIHINEATKKKKKKAQSLVALPMLASANYLCALLHIAYTESFAGAISPKTNVQTLNRIHSR
jgi:hypothetical protein